MTDTPTPAADGNAPTLPAWGHRCGMLSLGEAVIPADARAVADRSLFSERIARYCWAYDERQLDLLADCFTEDGVWEGNVLGEIPVGPFTGRPAIRKWLSEFWPHQRDQRRHMILNTIVESQSEDAASTLSYLLLMSSDGERPKLETTGFYRVDYRREGDAWRISRLTAGFDAPFWPGNIKTMSERGRARHGVKADA
jgi:hypothetical protein